MSSYPNIHEEAPLIVSSAVKANFENGKIIDFTEKTIDLSEIKEAIIVLYFYPKDNTPGCTLQACNLRDNLDELNSISEKIYVFGVSPDDTESHKKFISKHNLNFPLISDTDKKIAQDYGVWVEKSMFGKKYMGVERTAFIISKDGNLLKVMPKVKTSGFYKQLKKEISNI